MSKWRMEAKLDGFRSAFGGRGRQGQFRLAAADEVLRRLRRDHSHRLWPDSAAGAEQPRHAKQSLCKGDNFKFGNFKFMYKF